MEVNAIIDKACTKTVSRKNWLHNFLKCLDDTLKLSQKKKL